MKEFVLIFKMDGLPELNYSPEELQPLMKKWESWIDGIIANDILVSRGNRLGAEIRIVKPGVMITNGPYAEIKEIIGGYIIIRANSIDEAAQISMGCPLIGDSNIEIRNIYTNN